MPKMIKLNGIEENQDDILIWSTLYRLISSESSDLDMFIVDEFNDTGDESYEFLSDQDLDSD